MSRNIVKNIQTLVRFGRGLNRLEAFEIRDYKEITIDKISRNR